MAGDGAIRRDRGAGPRVFLVGALFVVVGALAIFGTVAVAFSVFLGSACACAATPTPRDPNWTPTPSPPVSLTDAAVRASKLAGAVLSTTGDWQSLGGQPIAESTGSGVVAYVGGNSGAVLEIVFTDRLPSSDSVTVTADGASAASERFLLAGGATTEGLTARASLVDRASVAYYDITWTSDPPVTIEPAGASSAAGGTAVEMLVEAANGAVFAYRDLRSGATLTVPIIGHAAAIRLAERSSYAGGETAGSDQGDQTLAPGLDGPWTWMVGFPDGVLVVDATAGDVTVAKWSSR
jgi:hypothetical protein